MLREHIQLCLPKVSLTVNVVSFLCRGSGIRSGRTHSVWYMQWGGAGELTSWKKRGRTQRLE